jgi:hypothetical protein
MSVVQPNDGCFITAALRAHWITAAAWSPMPRVPIAWPLTYASSS